MDTDPLSPGQPAQKPPSPAASPSARDVEPVSIAPMVAGTRRESALAPLAEIFVGPEGLYPAARWLVYIFMALILLSLLNSVLYSLRPWLIGTLWWSMAAEARLMLVVVLPGFVMARIERCPFGEFGLPAKGAFGRDFWVGATWGIGALTVLILVLGAVGVFTFGSFRLHGSRIFEFAIFYAAFFLIVAFFEDFMMRGYSQWVLAKSMNFWPAAAMLSVFFGAIHYGNPGEDRIGLAAVVVIGFFFCLTLRRTGNLWWAVGFHTAWDWGESYLYSVPDSGGVAPARLLNSSLRGPDWLTGGSVGPEGSYLVFVVMAVLWLLFSRVYPEVKYRHHEQIRNGPEMLS